MTVGALLSRFLCVACPYSTCNPHQRVLQFQDFSLHRGFRMLNPHPIGDQTLCDIQVTLLQEHKIRYALRPEASEALHGMPTASSQSPSWLGVG